jgi:nicotinamidase-related amidase
MKQALIVIDVQESFRQRPLWQTVNNPELLSNVTALVEHARAAENPVFWVLHSEPGTGGLFDPAREFVRVMSELQPLAGEPVLTKTSHNAFTTTNLQQQLTSLGVRGLTVCGIRTEQCCETTTRVGSDLGYDVAFITDATATFPIPHRSAPANISVSSLLAHPLTLPASEVVERTEYALAGRFATVLTTKELTGS